LSEDGRGVRRCILRHGVFQISLWAIGGRKGAVTIVGAIVNATVTLGAAKIPSVIGSTRGAVARGIADRRRTIAITRGATGILGIRDVSAGIIKLSVS
jgi:hypothetical protein